MSSVGWAIGLGAASVVGAGVAGYGYGKVDDSPVLMGSSKPSLALLTASGIAGSFALMNVMAGLSGASRPVLLPTVGIGAALVACMAGATLIGQAIGTK